MSTDKNDEFRDLTIQLRDQYRKVSSTVAALCSEESTAAKTEDLQKINDLLMEVKTTEFRLKPIRELLQTAGESISPDLKPAIDETIQIVLGLIPRIADLEKAAIKSRNELSPQIRASVRAIQMQNAYTRGS